MSISIPENIKQLAEDFSAVYKTVPIGLFKEVDGIKLTVKEKFPTEDEIIQEETSNPSRHTAKGDEIQFNKSQIIESSPDYIFWLVIFHYYGIINLEEFDSDLCSVDIKTMTYCIEQGKSLKNIAIDFFKLGIKTPTALMIERADNIKLFGDKLYKKIL